MIEPTSAPPIAQPVRPKRKRALPIEPVIGLPDPGDPRRPVYLAARSMRLLCGLLFLMTIAAVWMTYASTGRQISVALLVRNVGPYAAPAVLYLVCTFGLLNRNLWAIVTALVVASFHLLASLAMLGGVALLTYHYDDADRGRPAAMWVLLAIAAFWPIALGQLIWHLIASIRGIRFDSAGYEDGAAEGFDVVTRS